MCLQLVWDRFIAGQAECSLRRHLDSVGPDTPIRDIVDRCRVWESHAEDTDKWGVGRGSERPRAVYQVASLETDSKPKDASEDSDVLGMLMRRLLPTPAASPPKATPIPSDRELFIQRLLGTVNPVQPVVQERSGIMDIEVLLPEYASSRIGGGRQCTAADGSSGADGRVFFMRRVGPCNFAVSCSE